MGNLSEQLRTAASWGGVPHLLNQAADDLDAKDRLIALASALAGAVKKSCAEPTVDAKGVDYCCSCCQVAYETAQAFTAAHAEYQTHGTVPCGECAEWIRKDYANAIQVAEVEHEREEARRQLLEAQAMQDADLAQKIADVEHENTRLKADNAALREALEFYANTSNWHRHVGTTLSVIVDDMELIGPAYSAYRYGGRRARKALALFPSRPGAALLAELATLRELLWETVDKIPEGYTLLRDRIEQACFPPTPSS